MHEVLPGGSELAPRALETSRTLGRTFWENPVATCPTAYFPRNRYQHWIGLERVAGKEGGDTTETNEGSAIPPLLRAWKQGIDHETTLT